MVEGGEKGVGRGAQSALQHAARLYTAVALPFEAADYDGPRRACPR
jgi:hypothetical protein